MWFIGVEVEQETSAPPPKKNPGSAPEIVPCKSIGRKVSFKCSHHRFSSTDSKVRTTLQNSFFHPAVKGLMQFGISLLRKFLLVGQTALYFSCRGVSLQQK